MSEQLRLMAVHAHPDDESSKGAATMARYVREGVDVLVVTCTGGERGDVLNPKLAERSGDQANMRRSAGPRWSAPARSSACARTGSGSSTPDGSRTTTPTTRPGCPRAPSPARTPRRPREPLVKLMREFRPHVVTHLRRGGRLPAPRPHPVPPGHMAAFEAAPDADRYPRRANRGSHSSSTTTSASRGEVRGPARGVLAAGLE